MNRESYLYKILNFIEILVFVFMGLKLCNLVDWSWYVVFSPIWLPIAAAVIIVAIMLVISVILVVVDNFLEKTNRKRKK